MLQSVFLPFGGFVTSVRFTGSVVLMCDGVAHILCQRVDWHGWEVPYMGMLISFTLSAINNFSYINWLSDSTNKNAIFQLWTEGIWLMVGSKLNCCYQNSLRSPDLGRPGLIIFPVDKLAVGERVEREGKQWGRISSQNEPLSWVVIRKSVGI